MNSRVTRKSTGFLTMSLALLPLMASAQIVTATINNPTHACAELNTATQNLNNVSVLVIPRGTYTLDCPWLIKAIGSGEPNQVVTHNIKIIGHGVELFTRNVQQGDFPAIKIHFPNAPYQLTLEGFSINHLDNQLAPSALEVVQSAHVHLTDITVESNNYSPGYAAFYIHGLDATGDTGTFWTVIDRATVGKRSSLYGHMASTGVRLEGGANATTIQNSSFSNVYSAVTINAAPGGSYIANGVLIQGNWIEGFAEAIRTVSAQVGSSQDWRVVSGLRILNNRVEGVVPWESVFFRYGGPAGSTLDPDYPPILANNYLVGVDEVVTNDARRKVVIMDTSAPEFPYIKRHQRIFSNWEFVP